MTTFKTRLSGRAKTHGRIILALDHDGEAAGISRQALGNIRELSPFLCGIKLNFHLLLPLGRREIARITGAAHRCGLEAIADIKLNDIGNTNSITAGRLWDMGFDAVIANPIMGPESLKRLASQAHKKGKGVISLCHMSAPEARLAYDMKVGAGGGRLYHTFLDWALRGGADGLVVGATFPDIIKYCAKKSGGRLAIFSPGVGVQGGAPSQALSSGSDYIIVGRSILRDADPASAARRLFLQTLGEAGH